MKLEEAAALLARELSAPAGAVNTMAIRRGESGFIRVLIDPEHVRFARPVPRRYRGYAVVVEARVITTALA
jgi:hypothetical protein